MRGAGTTTWSMWRVYSADMNVEGLVNEYDKGLKGDTIGGKDLAAMNKSCEYINGVVYMVNFVYINFYEYLTAELYMMVTLVSALWMWKRRSMRRRMKKSHLSYYEFQAAGTRADWTLWNGEKRGCATCSSCTAWEEKAKASWTLSTEEDQGCTAVQRTGYGRITCGSRKSRWASISWEDDEPYGSSYSCSQCSTSSTFIDADKSINRIGRVQRGFSKHQMCLQEKTQWCFRLGSFSSPHGYIMVTKDSKKCWRRLKHYEMIQLILRLLQQRKRSSVRNSTRCWQLTWKVDVSTWSRLEWKLRMDSCYGGNFTKSSCHLPGRGVWLWLRHFLPTLRFQRRRAVWNVCWRLSRWCNSLRSYPRATTQVSLSQLRLYGGVMQRWANTYNWLWLTARRMVTSERQSCPMIEQAR